MGAMVFKRGYAAIPRWASSEDVMEGRWLAAIALLLAGLVAGPALSAVLLLNEPAGLGEEVGAYRLFAVLAGGVLGIAPIAGVAMALGRQQPRWLLAALLLLVFPALLMVGVAVYLALRLWS